MHPMHALSARDPMQQHQHQHQQIHLNQEQEQQNQTMTVLETLNPAQQQQQQQHSVNNEQQAQVMGMIDPLQAQRQQHLVQQQPHLHQLQPSQQTIEHQTMTVDELHHHQQQQQQHHHIQQQQQQHQHSIEQRPQIISGEGIVADSGGPIVQWLLENYEIAEGESLPRSTVYNHYLAHCRQLQMASVNAASFGKLIRSVFVGLKTRRLGTRGHSKYHYFGVRAKQHVQHELLQHHETGGGGSSSAGCSRADQNDNSNHRTEDGSESDCASLAGANGPTAGDCSSRLAAGGPAKRIKRSSNQPTLAGYNKSHQHVDHHHHNDHQQQQQQQQQHQQHTIELASNGLYYATNNGLSGNTNGYGKSHHHNGTTNQESPTLDSCDLADSRNHLGANWSTLVDEHWPQRQDCLLEQQIKTNEWSMYLELFELNYKSYYKRMVELLSELKFSEAEQLWQQFWRPAIPDNNIGQPQSATAAAEEHCWPTTTTTTTTTTSSSSSPSTTTAAIGAATDQAVVANLQQRQGNGHQQLGDFQQQQQQQVELTFHCLYQLTSQPLIVERITQIDQSLFGAIESFLFPDMLSPIPSLLRQQIEMFAINFGPCIEMAVKDYDPHFVSEKSKSARAFGYALRRYTELNRLSTASRAIWEKRSSLNQLSMDLSRIDLRYIEHQVSLMTNHKRTTTTENHLGRHSSNHHRQDELPLVAQSGEKTTGNHHSRATTNDDDDGDETMGNNVGANKTIDKGGAANNENTPILGESNHHHINHQQHHSQHQHQHQHHHHHLCAMQPGQLIQNFLHLLEDPYPANSWPDWCRNLFESRVCGLSMEGARNFVLDEWKNYISRIEKELTLRSAPSLSSFHLIKLLFGEYIDYLVDTRLVQAQAQAQLKNQIHLPGG